MIPTLENKIPQLWVQYEKGEIDSVFNQLDVASDGLPLVGRTLLGLCCLRKKDYERSTHIFEGVLKEEPQNPVAHLYLILSSFQLGDMVKASRCFDSLEVLHPHTAFLEDFIDVFWPLRFTTSLRGYALLPKKGGGQVDRPDPWESSFERQKSLVEDGTADKEAVRLAEKYFELGIKRYYADDRQNARIYFSRSNDLAPKSTLFSAHHGYLELLFGDGKAAHQALVPLVQEQMGQYEKTRNPEDLPSIDLLVSYAWSLHELGHHRQALEILSLVFPEGPEDSGSYFVSSVCWLMLGEKEAFKEAFSQAMKAFFIDTWEQLLRPFLLAVRRWLREEAGKSKTDFN